MPFFYLGMAQGKGCHNRTEKPHKLKSTPQSGPRQYEEICLHRLKKTIAPSVIPAIPISIWFKSRLTFSRILTSASFHRGSSTDILCPKNMDCGFRGAEILHPANPRPVFNNHFDSVCEYYFEYFFVRVLISSTIASAGKPLALASPIHLLIIGSSNLSHLAFSSFESLITSTL